MAEQADARRSNRRPARGVSSTLTGSTQVVTTARCEVCGPLEPLGRRTLDSTAEHHTKTTQHLTVVTTKPAGD